MNRRLLCYYVIYNFYWLKFGFICQDRTFVLLKLNLTRQVGEFLCGWYRRSNLLALLLCSLCYGHQAIGGYKFEFTLWLPIKVMKAIIGDRTNKIIEINLIWPTYGGSNARRTLLLLSNMRQIAQTLDSISFYPTVDYTATVRWTTMNTAQFRPICSHPFLFLIHCDDQKVNSCLLLFHYRRPILKNMSSDDDWGTSNLQRDVGGAAQVAPRTRNIQCVYIK